MTNIILFGFQGCGKTYWGKKLAQASDADFIDTDHVIENLYEQEFSLQCSCRKIYQLQGEAFFRHLEWRALVSLQHRQKCVIALGGGAVLSDSNQMILRTMGCLVFLKVPSELLKKRIMEKGWPAFLDPHQPDAFDTLYTSRLKIYEALASHHVDCFEEATVLKQLKEIRDGK